MEFVSLERYLPLMGKKMFVPFSELRNMNPVFLTQDLMIHESQENLKYTRNLAGQGVSIVPVRRLPPFPKYLERKDFPRRILFEMTSKCNYLCRMCPQNNLIRPRIDMPGQLYRTVIDEIDSHGVEGLWLYHLGESLLHEEWMENIAHIGMKRNLGYIWMSTNGRLFSEYYINIALNSNISYINFSANSVTAETYNTIVPNGHENFSVVQMNLDTLYRAKPHSDIPKPPFIRVQMIEQETTHHEVDDFLAQHVGRADLVSVNMLEYTNLSNNKFGVTQRIRKPLQSCTRVSRNDCFICSNGDVTLCDAAYNGEILLGNVGDSRLYDIWNGPERKRIMDLNENGRMSEIRFCQSCLDYDI